MLKLDFGLCIAHACLQCAAKVVHPAERRSVVTVLGSRGDDVECKVVLVIDLSRRPIAAPVHTIGHHSLVRIVIHADDGAACERIDDGIGFTAGRDAHATGGGTVRHLVRNTGIIHSRPRLEEHIGISIPQSLVVGQIIRAQLIQVHLKLYGRRTLRDGICSETVGTRYDTRCIGGIVLAISRKEIREHAHFHRDIVWRCIFFPSESFIGQTHF